MDLNIRTESTVLKMTLESGLVLNLQIPNPIQLTIANGMYWGGIGGNIERQADLMQLFEGRNAKKPHLDVAFFGNVYNNDNHLGSEGAGRILVRDKNNAIQDDDYIILYYWDRRNKRIAAFAGGNGDKKIYPVRWGTLPYKSWKHRDKGWKDDWRELPYKMSDIMQRITYLIPEKFNDLMWEGGYLKHTLLGTMSFVGGPRGNGYSTKLWIGVARGVSYNVGEKGMNYAHFVVEDLMHRIPFYLRCLHKPDQVTENDETTYVKGHVKYSCSHTRKPHLNFEKELDIWPK